MPENEAQARELAKIGSDNQIATTWTKVVKQSPKNKHEIVLKVIPDRRPVKIPA